MPVCQACGQENPEGARLTLYRSVRAIRYIREGEALLAAAS
jgi:hypothetical protein